MISLPHSSFKPYASVATFILVFGRGGTTNRVWMYQVSADGFSQDGARQPIEENDIPDLISQWRQRTEADYTEHHGKHGWISAGAISEENFEFAPRRFFRRRKAAHSYPERTIGHVCTLDKGATPAAKAGPGKYPLVTTAEELRSSSSFQFDGEAVCVPLVSSTGHGHASMKRLTYIKGKFAAATIIAVLRVKDVDELSARYLYYYLEAHKDDLLVPLMKGVANVSLSLGKIGAVKIPVPPLRTQLELTKNLGKIDTKLEKARAAVDELRTEKVKALHAFKAQTE